MTVMFFVLTMTSEVATRASAASLSPSQLSIMRTNNPRHIHCQNINQSSILSQLHEIRGGGSEDPPSGSEPYNNNNYGAQQQQQQPPQMMGSPNFQSTSSSAQPTAGEYNNMNGMGGAASNTDPNYEYRETVEDRIDAWRKQQQVCDFSFLLHAAFMKYLVFSWPHHSIFIAILC